MSKRNFLARSIQAAILVSTGAAASHVVAQDVVEEVVVTGIRASLQSAIDTKRDSDTIVEAISSEDVGKFPDKNVAESLSRLAGVSISRDFGEGERITIRGAGPDFNRTLLNGQTVGTADWFILDNPARSFNYTLLPSSLVSSLEVHKASMADIDEGSLGGTVIVNTRRPLDLQSGTVNLGISAGYGEKSGEMDPSANALVSWKSDSERFGALVSVSRQENTVDRSGFEVLGWSDNNANGIMTPTVMGAPRFVQERELTTLFASVQFAPTDDLLFTLDALSSKLDSDNMNANWLAWVGDNEAEMEAGVIAGSSAVAASTSGNGRTGVNYINRVSSTETDSLTLNVEYTHSAFDLDAAIGTTEAKGGTYRETSWEYATTGASWEYDLRDPSMSIMPEATDAAAYGAGWIWGGEKPTTDSEDYAQIDIDLPVEFSVFTSLEFGAKIRDGERTQDRVAYSWHGPGTYDETVHGDIGWNVYLQHIFNECPDLSACGLDSLGTVNIDAPVGGNITDQLAHNRDVMEEIAFVGLNGVAADYARSRILAENWAVSEDTFAFYAKANFEGANYRGNVGLRYVSTDQTSGGWNFSSDSWGFHTLDRNWLQPSTLEWVEVDNSYSEVLPSANFIYDLNDEMVVRVAASRVMARQNWADLSPYETFGSLNVSNPTGNAGNPNLKPFLANKFDVSYEWYYGDASMFAATFFYNDQESYNVGSTYVKDVYNEEHQQDPTVPEYIPVTFTQNVNGNGGTTTGVEFSVQHDFGGFGVQGNYSYASVSADDPARDDKIPGVSEHTANLMGYYENDVFGARLMYNYRSDFYNGLHWNGNDLSTDAYGQIDATATWYVTDSFQLDFEALNLGNEQVVQYSENENRLMSVYENGRRFVISGRFSF